MDGQIVPMVEMKLTVMMHMKVATTVNFIMVIMEPHAVIQSGMTMVLTVPHLKPITAGIALVVAALVIKKVNVVMEPVMSMKTVKPVKPTVVFAANVTMVI